MSQTYNIGKVSLTPRGAYSSTAQYTQLDIISHNGSSYLVLQDCSAITPPNSTYYMLLASKGNTGSAGASPTIAAGTVTMTPAGTSASVTNVGTNVNASFNFTIPNGNLIYTGTAITGSSTTPTVFSGSGVSNAGVGDIYINTNTVSFYRCTIGGAASVAKWVFLAIAVPDGSITTAKLSSSLIDILNSKANVDGVYEQMTVGNAEQLVSSVGIEDKVPYNFRTSGGSVDIGDRETDMVVGGTLAYNQILYSQNRTETDVRGSGVDIVYSDRTITLNGTASDWGFDNIRYASSKRFFLPDHVYYCCGLTGKVALEIASNGSPAGLVAPFYNDKIVKIPNYTGATASWIRVRFYKNDVFDNDAIEPSVFDLTLMFGATIANYINSLEQSTAGAGVAWCKKLFPMPVYPRNDGGLLSVNTTAHITTGFNQWDEQWELGGLNNSTGEPASVNDRIRSKNFCRCLPNTVYYAKTPKPYLTIWWYDGAQRFLGYEAAQDITGTLTITSPATAMYFKLVLAGDTTTYGNDICVNYSWDGERNGEYEPYVKNTYALDSSLELRGIPKLDANNKLYYDGDTYESNGVVTRKYKKVAISDLDWSYNSNQQVFVVTISDKKEETSGSAIANILTTSYVTVENSTSAGSMTDKTIKSSISSGSRNKIYVKDSAYTDVATFKTAMNGVYLIYELATPTTETANTYNNPQTVNDFGTEEYVDERSVQIPVGHTTLYQANLRAKIEMMPNSPDGDGVYVVQQEDGLNTYIPLVIPDELPTAPVYDGTYKLVCTVLDGTPSYSWVSN